MGDWMKNARARARELDQSTKKNSYKERLHLAGESARKNGLAPQPVETASSAIKPVETKIADPMAGLHSRESNQYLLSDNLKTAGEQLKSDVNARLVTDGEFANAAVNNLRANGQTEAADNLKSQLDALERERHIAELRAKRAENEQRNGMTDFQYQLAKTKEENEQQDIQREVDQSTLETVEDELFIKHLEGINARNQGDTAAYDAAYEDYGKLKNEAAELRQKIDPSSMENAAEWEWDMAELLESTGEADKIRQIYEKGKELRESYTTDMIGSEERYWEEQTYRNDLRKLKEKYGKDMVEEWFAYYDRAVDREHIKDVKNRADAAVRDGVGSAVGQNVLSVGANLLSGFGYLDAAAQKLQRELTGSRVPVNYNSELSVPGHYARAVRGSTADVIEQATEGKRGSDTFFGNLYSLGYQTGMSVLDTLAAVAVGNHAAPVLLAGSAADSTMRDALSRGATDGQALGAGLLAGAVETAMEKLSIDSLLDLNSPSVILNILKQAGVEGSEEFLTTLANGAMDALVMGDKSQLNLSKQRYEDMDFEPGEAERLALRDFGKQALTDALSGMISGGATAYGKAGIDASYELADLIGNWNGWDNFNGGGWNGTSGLQWLSPYGQLQPALADGWVDPQWQNKMPVPDRNGQAKDGINFIIGKTTTNQPFVEVETDILDGVPEADQIKVVKDNLKKKFPNGVPVGNNLVQIDEQSRREMTRSKYMQWEYNNDKSIYTDKLRVTDNSDEILQAATGWVNEALGHPRKDKIVEFSRGSVLLRIGSNDYSAEVVVGKRDNGKLVLYDVLRLKPVSFTKK